MISIKILFWFFVFFFAMVGYMRGWQKEVIALSGLIASLAALSIFGFAIITAVNNLRPIDPTTGMTAHQQSFWIQFIIHIVLAFFAYDTVGRIAQTRISNNIERKLLGSVIGALNGYILVGGLWGFLEYIPSVDGYVRWDTAQPYFFESANMIRPAVGSAAMEFAQFLPMGMISSTWWLIFFFLAFVVVIVALI